MGSRAGLCLCLASLWIVTVVESSFRNEDVIVDVCRIRGVTLAKMKDGKYHFDFLTAGTVCQLLGLTLATKAQVEEARVNGFETCSFGWVADITAVISRINPNEKCGQNRTGTATWNVPQYKVFNAYCFNGSDTLINSCKPDPTTTGVETTTLRTSTFEQVSATGTAATDTKTSKETETTAQTRWDLERKATHVPTTSSWPINVKTLIPKPATQCYFLQKLTTPELKEDLSAPSNNKGALKSDQAIFGGLPTALLILALIFFAAAFTLAVCYIRKYKSTLQITSMGKKTENVEVKVLKETNTKTKSSNEEQKQNGKPAENPQTQPTADTAASSATVAEKSVEAEV